MYNRLVAVLTLALTVSVMTVGNAYAAETKKQTKCPIMGGDIDKNVYTDHDGKRVYFCCAGCIDKFEANSSVLLKKMADEGIVLDMATVKQTKCPLTGMDIKKAIHADHEGKRVYFCCPGCVGKFNENPEKYIKQLEEKGVKLDKVS